MKLDVKKVHTKANIFRTLNGRDMTISDYMRNASDDELVDILQERFKCKGTKKEILEILKTQINSIIY